GHLLGDQGSGYDLVRRAAAAVVLAVDGMSPETSLTEALCAAFAVPSPARLGAVLQQRSQGEVAAALPVVIECAQRGDEAAAAALADGMDMLAMVANAAVRSAGVSWDGLPVHLGGGVLVGSEPLRELLHEGIRRFGASKYALVDAEAAANGAARLAAAWHQRQQPMCRWVDDGAL
ncbi:MAG: BadF/BadG/BcrA/BcrD ATPase family protein, partial [Planctomycetota bacterium]